MEARKTRRDDVLHASGAPPRRAPVPGLRLRLRLLGELRVERGGVPVALPASKRTRALLGYLAATAASHTRAHLCDLLWDGPDDPRAELRWSLTKLRPVVDAPQAPCLEADRERVALRGDGVETDLAPLRPLLAAPPDAQDTASLEAAAAALGGEFLAGLELPGCHRFHQWCMAERETWSALRLRLLAELVRRLQPARPDGALPHARAWVAADPFAEDAHAALLRCLLALGRPRDAQAHWRQTEALFARELGVAPAGALREAGRCVEGELARRAGAGTPPDTPAGAPLAGRQAAAPAPDALAGESPPAPSGGPSAFDDRPFASPEAVPFVGRQAERAAIDAALDSLRAPRRRPLLLFVGEPGIGKTRLLDRLAERAAHGSARVLRARCFEAEMLRPYGAWIDALRGVDLDPPGPLDAGGDADRPAAGTAAGLPHAARSPLRPLAGSAEAGAGGDRARLLEAAAQWLEQLAARQPLVVLLDDLQWLDDASAALLHYAVRSADGAAPLLFAAAARDGEIDDNPALRAVLQSLAREARLHRLALAPLAEDEVQALLAQAAPGADAASAHRASGGNPWFALAVAHAMTRADGMPGEGDAHAGDDDAWRTLAVEPLQRLDAAHHDVLACAAVMGRGCLPELLGDALQLDELELGRRLARLERRRLLRPVQDGRYDFAHDLVREAVYRGLPPAQRRAMQRRIVRALERAAAADPGLHGELAHHAIETAQHALAVRACIAAARHCLRVYANMQALSLAERAAPSLAQLPAGAERLAATVELVQLRVLASVASPSFAARVPGWTAELREAVDAAQWAGLQATAAAGLHMLSWLAQQCNDIGGTREATLRAELMSRGGDDAARCMQLANTGRCLMEVESDLPRARELIAAAARLAQSHALQVIELEWGRGLAARWDGDLDEAQRRVQAAVHIARAREDRWREFECLSWLATIEYERGRWEAVRALGGEIARVAVRVGGGLNAPFGDALSALAAWAAAAPGAPDAATRAALDAALARLLTLDDKAHLAYALNQRAALELRDGDAAAAAVAAARALEAARTVRRATEIAAAQALLARAQGGPQEAPPPPGALSARARGLLAGRDAALPSSNGRSNAPARS